MSSGVAQVEALFGSILIATATASATSPFIAAGLISHGFVALGRGLAWVLYLHALGVCNLALRRLYLRSRPVRARMAATAEIRPAAARLEREERGRPFSTSSTRARRR
jgi:hypothetical protein